MTTLDPRLDTLKDFFGGGDFKYPADEGDKGSGQLVVRIEITFNPKTEFIEAKHLGIYVAAWTDLGDPIIHSPDGGRTIELGTSHDDSQPDGLWRTFHTLVYDEKLQRVVRGPLKLPKSPYSFDAVVEEAARRMKERGQKLFAKHVKKMGAIAGSNRVLRFEVGMPFVNGEHCGVMHFRRFGSRDEWKPMLEHSGNLARTPE
jgi:hypothetical protein